MSIMYKASQRLTARLLLVILMLESCYSFDIPVPHQVTTNQETAILPEQRNRSGLPTIYPPNTNCTSASVQPASPEEVVGNSVQPSLLAKSMPDQDLPRVVSLPVIPQEPIANNALSRHQQGDQQPKGIQPVSGTITPLGTQSSLQHAQQVAQAIQTQIASIPAQTSQAQDAIIFSVSALPGIHQAIYVAQGGHQVNLMYKAGQWWADINEHLPIGFSRKLDLPVYWEPGIGIEALAQYLTNGQQHCVHVCFPEQDPCKTGYVYVGSLGLRGGGKPCIYPKNRWAQKGNKLICPSGMHHERCVASPSSAENTTSSSIAPQPSTENAASSSIAPQPSEANTTSSSIAPQPSEANTTSSSIAPQIVNRLAAVHGIRPSSVSWQGISPFLYQGRYAQEVRTKFQELVEFGLYLSRRSNSDNLPDYAAIARAKQAQHEAWQRAWEARQAERARQEVARKAQREQEASALKQKEEAYRLATAKKSVREIEQFFIPNESKHDVREIKEDIAYLKEDLEEIAADTPLPQEQRALIGSIADQIDKVTKNLKPLYREMKALAARRGGDELYLSQDTSHLDASRREAFEKEALRIRRRIEEYPQLARQLLNELQGQREELSRILSERNETLGTYGYEAGYESDPEHDYTSAQLAAYLHTYYLSESADHPLIQLISEALGDSMEILIHQLGSEQMVSRQDFEASLQPLHSIANVLATYETSHGAPLLVKQVLQAIVAHIPSPYGRSFQVNQFNEIRKRFHKLKSSLTQVVQAITVYVHEKQIQEIIRRINDAFRNLVHCLHQPNTPPSAAMKTAIQAYLAENEARLLSSDTVRQVLQAKNDELLQYIPQAIRKQRHTYQATQRAYLVDNSEIGNQMILESLFQQTEVVALLQMLETQLVAVSEQNAQELVNQDDTTSMTAHAADEQYQADEVPATTSQPSSQLTLDDLASVEAAVSSYLQKLEQYQENDTTSCTYREHREKGKTLLSQIETLKKEQKSTYRQLGKAMIGKGEEVRNRLKQQRKNEKNRLNLLRKQRKGLKENLGLTSDELQACGIALRDPGGNKIHPNHAYNDSDLASSHEDFDHPGGTRIPDELLLNNGKKVKVTFGTTKDQRNANNLVNPGIVAALKEVLNSISKKMEVTEIHISATTNGEHASYSNHSICQEARAMDISRINGQKVIELGPNHAWVKIFQACLDELANIRENFGPERINKLKQKFPDPNRKLEKSHKDHIHFSINP